MNAAEMVEPGSGVTDLDATKSGRRIRVLHVAPAFYPATYWGGPTFSTYGLCNALARRSDIELTVLTTDTAGPATDDRVAVDNYPMRFDAGYDVYFVRKQYGRDFAPRLIPELWRRAKAADVMHLTATYSFPSLPTMTVVRVRGVPLVWSPRGAIQATYEWDGARRKSLKQLWENVARSLLPRRSLIHATADVERHACAQCFRKTSAAVIPNGVDVPKALPERDQASDGLLRLMFLSRLDVKKGLENLIAAVAALPEHIVLDIYGTGTPEYVSQLKAEVQRVGAQSRISFAGHVEGEEKSQAFYKADIFVLPSYSENFGIVVAEALAHGVPVIASHGTPWAEVETKRCGLWVDHEPVSLINAVRKLERCDLKKMGALGRAWVEVEFSWDAVAAAMAQSYHELVGTPDASRAELGAPSQLKPGRFGDDRGELRL